MFFWVSTVKLVVAPATTGLMMKRFDRSSLSILKLSRSPMAIDWIFSPSPSSTRVTVLSRVVIR